MVGGLLAKSAFEERTAFRLRSGRTPPNLPIAILSIMLLLKIIPFVFCIDRFSLAPLHQLSIILSLTTLHLVLA